MSGTALQVVVGLGNPGLEHQLTRHNAGFWFVDALAAGCGAHFRGHARYQSELCKVKLGETELTLLKPQTYMNRSGLAIRALMDYAKISPEQILVVHDELDLPPGVARLKFGGGHGGHNGLRDTITHIGPGFWRLRLGVGHPGDKSEVIDYVLRRAPQQEETHILAALADATDALKIFIQQGAEKAMHGLHSKASSIEPS